MDRNQFPQDPTPEQAAQNVPPAPRVAPETPQTAPYAASGWATPAQQGGTDAQRAAQSLPQQGTQPTQRIQDPAAQAQAMQPIQDPAAQAGYAQAPQAAGFGETPTGVDGAPTVFAQVAGGGAGTSGGPGIPAGPGASGAGWNGWDAGQWPAAPTRKPAKAHRGLKWSLAGGALALAVLVGGVPGFALGHSSGVAQAESQSPLQQMLPGDGGNSNGTQTNPFGNGSDGGGSNGTQTDPFGGSDQGGQGFENLPFNNFGDGGSGGSSNGSSGRNSSVQQGTKLDSGEAGFVLINTQISGGTGAGTGMILSSDGLVLTNYHVVEGSTSVKVTDSTTGKTYTGTVVGHDAVHDVAVVQLKGASGLKTVQTNTGGVNTGDKVAAIGNASGEGYLRQLDGTVTATDQSITTQAEATSSGEKLTDLIETDADVVPGYSGGALVNSEGQVVGMTTAASSGDTSATVDGYAIPIANALEIAQKIQAGDAGGDIQIGRGAALGISILNSDTGQVGGGYGVTVNGLVRGGAAADSGIKAGDTIIGLDGSSVNSYSTLKEILAKHQPGDKVSLTWLTESGQQQTKTITLGESTVN